MPARRTLPALCALVVTLALPSGAGAQPATTAAQQRFLTLASTGVAGARMHWWNRRLHWYVKVLRDRAHYPLATIWDAVPLFESVDSIALAARTRANLAAVDAFARGAERYWDRGLPPHGGFAPYAGDRGPAEAWFDDNGWWGLAFVDAYGATGHRRYLSDARRALAYILAAGWDRSGGGLWWNTTHPYKAGEALAAATWLAAALYRATADRRYLDTAQRLQAWGEANLWDDADGLFARSDSDPTPMPYVEGSFVAADDALCRANAGQRWCDTRDSLLASTLRRFPTLEMGPKYDAIYLRALLAVYADTHDSALYALARGYGDQAAAEARDSGGLYLRAWDGSEVSGPDTVPGMLQTHAATVSLLAALATAAPPQA